MGATTLRTVIVTAALAATARTPLGAQVVREGARTSMKDAQVTFGYLCDDRFVVRNEGRDAVRLEYGLAKNDDRTALNLDGKESVELLLSTSDELDLFAGGKVIGSARRDYRRCDEVEGGGRVIVRPLEVAVAPTIIVSRYPVYRSYYDPWYYHHSTWFRPVIRIPIILGGRRDNDRGRSDRGRNDRDRDRDRGRDEGRNARRR